MIGLQLRNLLEKTSHWLVVSCTKLIYTVYSVDTKLSMVSQVATPTGSPPPITPGGTYSIQVSIPQN
jgi:hypothetical protein